MYLARDKNNDLSLFTEQPNEVQLELKNPLNLS